MRDDGYYIVDASWLFSWRSINLLRLGWSASRPCSGTIMDAWGTLIAGSTIASGDAWEHLQAQGGGGGGSTTILLAAGLSGNISVSPLAAEIVHQPLSSSITMAPLTGDIDSADLEAAVAHHNLTGSVTPETLSGAI